MKKTTKTYVQDHENNGGGSSFITRRQILLIQRLAAKVGSSAQSQAMEIYGRPISGLLGREAHKLIQMLQEKIDEQEQAVPKEKPSSPTL